MAKAENSTPLQRAGAAYQLAICGNRNVDDAAWRAFDEADYNTNACELAAEALLTEHGDCVVPQIRDRLHEKGMCTWMWSEIALLFAEEGAEAEALDLAAAVLRTRCDLLDDGTRAIEAMAIALRSREPEEAVATILRHAAQRPDYLGMAITKLAAQGAERAALILARRCLSEEKADSWYLVAAIEATLIDRSSQDAASIAELLLHPDLTTGERLQLCSGSIVPIAVDTVRAICKPVLAEPGSTTSDLTMATSMWLDRTNGLEATTVVELLRKHVLPPNALVNVLRTFARTDSLSKAVELVETLMRDITIEAESIAEGLRLCADHLPKDALDRLVPLVSGRLLGSERTHIADVLGGVGRPDLALPLWRTALIDPSTSIADRITAADQLVIFGSADSAAATLIEAGQSEGVTEAEARTLHRLAAWIRA
ncbi:hypothetical protein GCM10022247_36080 [Allokutzneria multivorans]|uniref:HEAT repeat domain-containing protein n=1 Tax=Allokutzneria multivorans TaxID=1142134 RepID=A0ABP7SEK1_9PSEU